MNVRLPLAKLAGQPSAEAEASPADGLDGTNLMQIGDLARESGKTVRAIHLYEQLGFTARTTLTDGLAMTLERLKPNSEAKAQVVVA